LNTMDAPDLVVVRTFGSVIDAQVAKGVLDAAGIESMIRADNVGGMYPSMTTAQLLVRRDDLADAETALVEGEE